MSVAFGFGCKLDRRSKVRRIGARLYGLSLALPDVVSIDSSWTLPPVSTQQGNSCTAFATAASLELKSQIDFGHHQKVSEIDLYYVGRARAGLLPQDDGTYLESVFAAAHERGFCLESEAPWDYLKINDPRGLVSKSKAFARRQMLSFESIDVTDVKEEICLHNPIVIGIGVDDDFRTCMGGQVNKLLGPTVGGHAMLLYGYDTESVWIQNSWGTGWGNGGRGRIAWSALSNRMCDLFAVEGAKT